MFWRNSLTIGACIALLGTTGSANATVVGTKTLDVALDLVVTDISLEIDPDESGPLDPTTFAPGAAAELDFDYLLDLPSGRADYTVDVRIVARSLEAIFLNPFPTAPDVLRVDVLDRLNAQTPLEVFAATFFLPGATPDDLLALAPVDRVVAVLAASSGRFTIIEAGTGFLPAGIISGSYDLDPGSTLTDAIGRAELTYAADGAFAAMRDPLLDLLPPTAAGVIEDTGLAGPGLFDMFSGIRGAFDIEVDVVAVSPVPLPAGLLLLSPALGALAVAGRRHRKPA